MFRYGPTFILQIAEMTANRWDCTPPMCQWIKSCLLVSATVMLLGSTGCGGAGSAGMSPTPTPTPTPNEWTWASGANVINQPGIYGTEGTTTPNSGPGARVSAVTWTDTSGNLWLFGGYGNDSTSAGNGDLNDLWKYSEGAWTWVAGSNTIEQPGTYGTQGSPAAGNVPGARYEATGSSDSAGDFWLFGGLGIDSTGKRGDLNDLWKYTGGQWTWMSGSANAPGPQTAGVYGTQGTPDPDNIPGARVDAVSWTDVSGNFWLFGGEGPDSTGTLGILNDLWKYSEGEWTWMSGSNLQGQIGTYGTLGTAAADNVPGSRTIPATWTDASGNFWLFGGEGNDSTIAPLCVTHPGDPCLLNDLWKYSAGQWTWMGGSNLMDQPGAYGTQGVPASRNVPGARWFAVSWIDKTGDLWLFGGIAMDSTGTFFGDINDLWKYSGGQWTWVSGSNLVGQTGTYGNLGTAALDNIPGARDSAVSWVDTSGDLWLFGGTDVFSISLPAGGTFNDLWKYTP
jgi:hypothetical protein